MEAFFRSVPWTTPLILVAGLVASLFLHAEHLTTDIRGIHAWRQSQTMWNIRNFARHDPNILNPRISNFDGNLENTYRYEFPLMQWTIAMVLRLFGEHIILVRLIMFIIGAAGTLAFFGLTRELGLPPPLASVSAVLFAFSPVFYYYTINPLPDLLALSSSVGYLFFIVAYERQGKQRLLFYASVCLALATLAKLPYLMFSVVSIFFFFRAAYRQRRLSNARWGYASVQFLFLIPAMAWYAWVMPGWSGNGILYGIFKHGVSWEETRRIFTFYYQTLFPHELLNKGVWIPFLIGLITIRRNLREPAVPILLAGISFLYLLLEYNMITTVHDYYMLPFLPWLFLLVAAGVREIGRLRFPLPPLLLGLVMVFTMRTTYAYTWDYWSIEKTYFNPDLFIHQDALKDAVPNDALCIIVNDHTYNIFPYAIDKMGFIFRDNYMPAAWVKDVIRRFGVRYMYSDSRQVEQQPDIAPLLDSLLLQAGSVRVYRLMPASALDPD